jgi:hypothetical protein
MIDIETLKVGDYIREIRPPHRHYTVVALGHNSWATIEPHMDPPANPVLYRIGRDIYAIIHDYEPAGKPECPDDISDDYPSLVRNHPNKAVQNPSPFRFDLIPAEAMLHIAKVIADGDVTHGRYNWKKIDALEHHGRAEAHITLARANDKDEDHWGHAAVRAIFALQMAIEEGKL